MRLTRLRLAGFRSYAAARLEFDGRPVVVWGANGAGKTNLVEAISLLSPGRGLRRARPEEIARRPDGIGWKIAAELSGGARGSEVETWAEPGQPRQTRIDGKAAPQSALGRLAPLLWLTPSMDRLWTEAPEGRRRFLDRAALSFAPDHGEAALAYDRAMRERNRLLRDQVRDARWYDALEAAMAGAGARLDAGRRAAIASLAAAQSGAATAFPAAALSLDGPDGVPAAPVSAEGLAAALAASRPADLRAGRALVGPHRADLSAIWQAKGMAAAECSTGEQKALLISLVLANARALTTLGGAAPILILDEVAAHLDAGRRAALYDEIAGLDAQAFLTGTGAELFAEMGARAERLEIFEAHGESRIHRHG